MLQEYAARKGTGHREERACDQVCINMANVVLASYLIEETSHDR